MAVARLKSLLGVEEIEHDLRLRVLLGSLLFYFHVSFRLWGDSHYMTLSAAGRYLCSSVPWWFLDPPFFWHFSPEFTRGLFHTCDILAMLGFVWCFFECLAPLLLLAGLFAVKFLFYISDFMLLANYDHMHLFFVLMFLVSRSRLFFMRAGLGVWYILSGLVKLTPSWLQGDYFNSIPGKFPLIPKEDWVVTAMCQLVILMELVGPLCWFSRYRWLRWFSMGSFVAFHLYSGVVVGFRYPNLMLPVVLCLFWKADKPFTEGFRCAPRDFFSWFLLALGLWGGTVSWWIPGDARLTGEGRYFGAFMYDAERRVQFEAQLVKGDERVIINVERQWQEPINFGTFVWKTKCTGRIYRNGQLESEQRLAGPFMVSGVAIFNSLPFQKSNARQIGDPYLYYRWAQQVCGVYFPDRLSLKLIQQLDGHEEEHVVLDIEDFQALNPTYHPLRRNPWIRDE